MIHGKNISLVADIPDEALAWRNDYDIWRWCRQYTLISRDEHLAWRLRISKDPTIRMFGVHSKKAGKAVGVCGLTSIDKHNQSAEFSLYIEPNSQGQGHGKEALRLLVEHGFYQHNLHRIWGETYDGNPAMRMFLSLGMKPEGVLRQAYFRDGKFIDVHRVAILRSEYNVGT